MLLQGALDGTVDICILAKAQGGDRISPQIFERMLENGIKAGHIDICRMAIEWGAAVAAVEKMMSDEKR